MYILTLNSEKATQPEKPFRRGHLQIGRHLPDDACMIPKSPSGFYDVARTRFGIDDEPQFSSYDVLMLKQNIYEVYPVVAVDVRLSTHHIRATRQLLVPRRARGRRSAHSTRNRPQRAKRRQELQQ